MKHWYAVYTRPGQEQKVAGSFAKKGIECFCPLAGIYTKGLFIKRNSWQPLLPSMLFVHISETEQHIVRNTSDVINFLFWLGKPATVPAAEMRSLQQFADRFTNIRVEKTAICRNLSKHSEPVSIKNNSSAEQNELKLVIPSLGLILIAPVHTSVRVQHTVTAKAH